MINTYPFGLACTPVELHRYQTGVQVHELLIIPPGPRETLTFLVYHQPFRQPQFSHKPSRARGTPDVRYIYAAEMVPYDPELADPASRHCRHLKRLVLQEASLISALTLRETRHS